jgi:hypothetical protein
VTSSSIRDSINEFFTRNMDKLRTAALVRVRHLTGIDVDDVTQAAAMRLLRAFQGGLLDPAREDVPVAQTIAWALADLKRAQQRQVATVSVAGHDQVAPDNIRAEMHWHAEEVLEQLDNPEHAAIVRSLLNGEEPALPGHLSPNTKSQRLARARQAAVALAGEMAA